MHLLYIKFKKSVMNRLLLLIVLVFSGTIFSQAPTTATTAVTFNSIQGDRAGLSISKGNGSSRLIVARKDFPVNFVPIDGTSYLASTVFGNGQEVALGEYVFYSGAGTSTTLTNLLPGSTYHIAVFEFNGSGLTSSYLVSPYYAGSFTTLSAPTEQVTNAQISNLTANRLTLSWTPGNGGYSIVLAKEGAPVNANPVDLVSYYAENTFYQVTNGPAQIGVGNFVLYKGTGSSFTVDNLNPNLTYHFAVFSYNGTTAPVYLTTTPAQASATTLGYPTVQASSLNFDSIDGDRLRATWTSGNGSGRLVLIRAGEPITQFPQDGTVYTGNSNFLNATDIGDGNKVVYSGAGSNVSVSNLVSGVIYYFAVFEYAGSGIYRTYNIVNFPTNSQGPVVAPTQNVVSVTASSVTSTQATLTMLPGNGSGRVVVVRPHEPVTYVPNDLNSFYANNTPNLNDSYGTVGGGHEVVYKGTGTQLTVTNAQPNTVYYVAAYEFNGSNGPIYNTVAPAVTTFTTLLPPAPTVATSNFNLSSVQGNSFRIGWTSGNGQRRVVLLKEGEAVTAAPSNGQQYAFDTNFLSAPELSPGEKIVYDGTAGSVEITGLAIGITYHARVYEYNGSGELTNYISTPLVGSGSTATAPTVGASGVYVTQINQNELRVYWTNGNGGRKLVVGRNGSPVDALPVNLTSYSANINFGSGSQIGSGNRVVYAQSGGALGTESFARVTNVSPGNTYHFSVFEFNGTSAPVYKTDDPGQASYAIGYEPLIPSSNVTTNTYDGASMRVSIGTEGGGSNRIIVAREGSPVSFLPEDGVSYAVNSNFSLGLDLGSDQKVVYNGSGTNVTVTGLTHSTTYYFAVFEYGGTGATIDYLTDSFPVTSGATLSPPSVQASEISFNGITSVASNVSWTNGNGSSRLVVAKRNGPVDVEPQDYTNYNWNQYFGTGGSLGNGNFVVYKGSANNITLQSLQSGSTYHVAVYEFNGSGTPVFLKPALTGSFTTLGPPQEQAVLQDFTSITTSSVRIHCAPGSGQKRLILMKAGSAITVVPSENTSYVANTFMGSGALLGDGTYAVYNGFDNEVTVTGLALGETYHVAIYEFNAFSGGVVNYLTPTTAVGSFVTSTDLCSGIVCPEGMVCYQGQCLTQGFYVNGRVSNYSTNAPLAGVAVANDFETVFTDAEGNYQITSLYPTALTFLLSGFSIHVSDLVFNTSLDVGLKDNCSGVSCDPGTTCFQGQCYPVDGDTQSLCYVSGVVREGYTNLPLSDVTVFSGNISTTTNIYGYYTIAVPVGSLNYRIKNLGMELL
jgi:hypothetical protein